MLILFFDTYISGGIGDKGGANNAEKMIRSLGKIRDDSHSYRWQEKIDVAMYTLASYTQIKWDRVIIRFECEELTETIRFSKHCKDLFPDAEIFNERSDTADKYFNALSAIKESDDAWIFYSPNNDHPYLAASGDLERYILIADQISIEYPENIVSLVYSHFTEGMTDNRMSDPQWGSFGNKLKKVIYEDADVVVSKANKAPLESCQIFKLSYLKKIFSSTKNLGRVIRLEDTEFILSRNHKIIQICPKIELCRHYDSYGHVIDLDFVPPLFIPDGFFENNIKIRYGYNSGRHGWVNVNPLKVSIGVDVDLLTLFEDIPHFWRDRISDIDINPQFPNNLDRSDLSYYKTINNPWNNRSKLLNLLRSLYILIILESLDWIRNLIRISLIKLGIIDSVRLLRSRFINNRY
jgi:hypothetical protein